MKKNGQHPFPRHAKPVFKGKIFQVWQWEQKMFDGSFKTFEGLKRPNSIEVFAAVGNKVMIQKQTQPHIRGYFYSIPSGRMDYADDPLQEAKRELLEESGYVSDEWELLKEVQPYRDAAYVVYYFVARSCYKKQKPNLDGGERITTKLISFDELLRFSDNPRFRGSTTIPLLLRWRLDKKSREAVRKRLFK